MSALIYRQVGCRRSFTNDLSIGDIVDIKAPSGKFCIPSAADKPIVLVAGGIGITPFMAHLETVAMLQPAPRIHLVYANRTAASEAFSQRLVELQRLIPSLTVTKFFSDCAHHSVGALSGGFPRLPIYSSRNLPTRLSCFSAGRHQ